MLGCGVIKALGCLLLGDTTGGYHNHSYWELPGVGIGVLVQLNLASWLNNMLLLVEMNNMLLLVEMN